MPSLSTRNDVGKRQVPAPVEQVAINDVVDAGHIRRGKQGGERKFLPGSRMLATAWHIARIVHVDANDAKPLEARDDWDCRRSRNCSAQAGEAVDQKFSSTKLPRNDRRSHILPARSGNEKSGALKGSISQVSTDEGRGSELSRLAGMRIRRRRSRKGLRQKLFAPSSISMRWLPASFRRSELRPLGQRTVARTVLSTFPTPKKSSLVCCDRNPEPACRYLVWRWPPASTVTAAPIASRLLFCPRRRNAIECPISFIALRKTRSCGAFRFLRTISSRPSWSRSARANERLSSGKSSPTAPETSENVPSRLLA